MLKISVENLLDTTSIFSGTRDRRVSLTDAFRTECGATERKLFWTAGLMNVSRITSWFGTSPFHSPAGRVGLSGPERGQEKIPPRAWEPDPPASERVNSCMRKRITTAPREAATFAANSADRPVQAAHWSNWSPRGCRHSGTFPQTCSTGRIAQRPTKPRTQIATARSHCCCHRRRPTSIRRTVRHEYPWAYHRLW